MNRTRTGLILAALILPAVFALQGCSKPAESPTEEAAAPAAPAAPRHKVVITAQVADVAAWEAAYRTHGEMFRSQGNISPTLIGSTDGNMVALYEETENLDKFMADIESQETQDAMKADGVVAGSVKVYVLDREFAF